MAEELSRNRIDKWLWSVRIFKTRNQAAEACRKGRVYVEGTLAKPSRAVAIGNTVVVRKPPVIFSYEVLQIHDHRLSAPLAKESCRNLTPGEELEKLDLLRVQLQGNRKKGSGRPTKKDRRQIDGLINN